MSPEYRQGRLVWAQLRAGSGRREIHPAVIITPNRYIIQPEKFDPRDAGAGVNAVAVVGVSTEYRKHPPFVRLPYSRNREGHPITKLVEDCGACVQWYDWVVLEDDVEGLAGDVPQTEMKVLARAIAADLRKRLATKAGILTDDLHGIYELLIELIGEP